MATSSKSEVPVDSENEAIIAKSQCRSNNTAHDDNVEEKLFVTDDDVPPNKCKTSETQAIHHESGVEDSFDGSAISCVKRPANDEDSDDRVNLELTKAFEEINTTESEDEKLSNGDHLPCSSKDASMPSRDDEGVLSEVWKEKNRHVFILSEAGKPIYSRHGDEDKLVTLFGLMQALVSVVQDTSDVIRSIKVGNTVIVFLLKPPLIFVGVSNLGESVNQIQSQLLYFYNQILSILTLKQLEQIFEKRKNYDLRRLISGSERLLHNLSNMIETDPSFVLGAVKCLPLASSVRDSISQTISQTLTKLKQNVVFAILVANNQLVSLVRMKKCFMHPMDLHLIINLIDSSESFKTAETWSPLCLPKFDSSGFVHAHVSYLSEQCQACLVLLTVDRESFFALSEAKKKIVERLKRQNCLEAIDASMNNNWPTMSFINVPEVRHFLYKSKSIAQFMSPALEVPYIDPFNSEATLLDPGHQFPPPKKSPELQRLYSKYYQIHSKLHAQTRPIKFIYQVDDTENWLGWTTSSFEIYVTFEPLVKKSVAISAVNRLLKWINREEERIFITKSATF